MDDYTREMMDLKTLVTRTLEKKGVLARIRVTCRRLVKSSWILVDRHSKLAELRASVFEAIEEEDKVIEKDEALPPALLGSCNDSAKQLHNSPSGRLLTALICEYLDWSQLNHTLKVYLPECNLPKESWKSELKEFSRKNGYDLNQNGESGPLLLDVLEGFLKPHPVSQSSDRRAGSSTSGYRKDEYNWRYDDGELPEDVVRASAALENLHFDRKSRNLTPSWRHAGDEISEDDTSG
ncbi:protein tonneau 1a [Phtheirospermum japonicum]|uniref:Protein tonneau 1a n=1 Tax=Phtheirospermum japonicum TaxID=374723 RepID=A0A830D5Q2_9LAMI|nr:protein tonneau 1a [Phtheirospermum japonicum]